MNWGEVQEDWNQFQMVLKTHWPKLGDDDLRIIDGKRERLAEALCNRYGWAKAEAESQIAEFEKEVRYPGDTIPFVVDFDERL